MSDRKEIVECEHHGKCYATYVCRHMARGANRGFYCSTEDDDPQPDAWCLKCDSLLRANGWEWNDEIEEYADIMLICAHCYDKVKGRNQTFLPSIEDEGWELRIVIDEMSDYPDMSPPSREELSVIKVGDLVKVVFRILGEDENGAYTQDERMWVKVQERTEQGYIGTLSNDPTTAGSLNYGEALEFQDKHILQIYKPEKHVGKDCPATRIIPKGKLQ